MKKNGLVCLVAVAMLTTIVPASGAETQYTYEGSTKANVQVWAANHLFAYTTEDAVEIDFKIMESGGEVSYADITITGATGEADCKGIDHDTAGEIDDLRLGGLGLNGFEKVPCMQLFVEVERQVSAAGPDVCELKGNLAGWNEARSIWKHIKLGGEFAC